MPTSGLVLEVASGTGEHAVYFARAFPQLAWQPSDADGGALASIADWSAEAGLSNLRPPILLDALLPHWPVDDADAVLCINMVHISSWRATLGLFAGAAQILKPGAPLILYGPFLEPEVATAPSNVAFDESLKGRDPAWGLRSRTDIDRVAESSGFGRTLRQAMPANNLVLVYRRLAT